MLLVSEREFVQVMLSRSSPKLGPFVKLRGISVSKRPIGLKRLSKRNQMCTNTCGV